MNTPRRQNGSAGQPPAGPRRITPAGGGPRLAPTPLSASRRGALAMLVAARDTKSGGMESWLENARAKGEISPQDAGLAREIACGVCRHRRWLEKLVGGYLHHPLPDQAWQVMECLLIGAYQTVYLERVPVHSIVDETVKLVGVARTEAGYRGLANAVMRKFVTAHRGTKGRPDGEVPWPVRLSVPDWLASEAGQLYRGAAEQFFEASNEQAPLQFRITHRAIEHASIGEVQERLRAEIVDHTHQIPDVTRGDHAPECLTIRGRGVAPEFIPSFRRGAVTAEDEGGQITGHLVGVQPGMRVLDLCASPGGKCAHLYDIAKGSIDLTATDVSEHKLQRLRETLSRLGIADRITIALATTLNPETTQPFDLILVDSPCSGLGTLRRHPEIRWRRQAKDIRSLSRQQDELLDKAARLLRPGGLLVYTVCTFIPTETDGAADRFLASHGDFSPEPAIDGIAIDDTPFRAGNARWRTSPHQHGCDAFFIARFRRSTAPHSPPGAAS